jgi:transposase
VATDPGASPFHAYYSPTSGEYGELFEGARSEFEYRLKKIDALQTRISKRKAKPPDERRTRRQRNRTTHTLKLKLAKDRRRIHGWMANAHYDAANFLLTRYDVVIEPKLAVARLVQKTARAMCTWGHYLFRQRLKTASSRYAGRHVIEVTEPGTSKINLWQLRLLEREARRQQDVRVPKVQDRD